MYVPAAICQNGIRTRPRRDRKGGGGGGCAPPGGPRLLQNGAGRCGKQRRGVGRATGRGNLRLPKVGKAPLGQANRRLPISPGSVTPAPFGAAAALPGSEPERLSAEVPGSDGSLRTHRPIERIGRRSWSTGPTDAVRRIAALHSVQLAREAFRPSEKGRRGREIRTCCPTCLCRTVRPLTDAMLSEKAAAVERRNIVLCGMRGLRD
jgi:hypothetical protein